MLSGPRLSLPSAVLTTTIILALVVLLLARCFNIYIYLFIFAAGRILRWSFFALHTTQLPSYTYTTAIFLSIIILSHPK